MSPPIRGIRIAEEKEEEKNAFTMGASKLLKAQPDCALLTAGGEGAFTMGASKVLKAKTFKNLLANFGRNTVRKLCFHLRM